jgi:HPt (histidine-containing phosphotransfer) domain-containing protein
MSEAEAPFDTLDRVHLAEQTFGDNALARVLLALFEHQCERLAPLMQRETALMSRSDAAHTLKGGARAVGAHRIAALGEAFEVALARGDAEDTLDRLSSQLDAAIVAMRAAIAAYLAEPV